jgi:hypothetical protein
VSLFDDNHCWTQLTELAKLRRGNCSGQDQPRMTSVRQ